MNGLADMGGRVKSLEFRIILAAGSGLGCWPVFQSGIGDQEQGYVICGALFAAGVLIPYLRYDRFLLLKSLGLIVLATISFGCANEAVWFARGDSFMPATTGFLAASLVGAFIVLTGARLIIPLNCSWELIVTGLPASIVGGLVFALLDESDLYLAFASWHSLMAVAIHGAENWWLRIDKVE